ncbi:MAG TPA: methyltransferase domain-containing protein [Bdellovibrio sp.]
MRTQQYQTHVSVNENPSVNNPHTFANLVALNGLCERETVRYLQVIVAEMYAQTLGLTALDLNSGRGVSAMALAELGFQVAAYDMHRQSISILQKIAVHQELNVSFGMGGIFKLETLQKKFDLIHDADCLTNMPNQEERAKFLRSVKKTLAADGKFVISCKVQSASYDPSDSFESLRMDENHVLWRQTPESEAPGVVKAQGKYWTASKCIPPQEILRQELLNAGFAILSEDLEVVPGNNPALLRLVLTSAEGC